MFKTCEFETGKMVNRFGEEFYNYTFHCYSNCYGNP